jgi:hypothetical protein
MSDFEDVKPYTQAELDQQAIWANEFDQWWESEGQYQRAGGGQYERTFAWWAWLNREQKQQAIIDDLKAQLNNMEACYIEKKKQVEAANTVLINWQDEYTEHTRQHECTTDAVLRTCITELEQALRGES